MELIDWLDAISDFLELRHMNSQEHRRQMILRLLLIPAAAIIAIIVAIINFLERA